MSTRSYICMEVGDNRYKTIYCHFDGYLDYNGKMLTEYYNDRARVEKLLELGYGTTIFPAKGGYIQEDFEVISSVISSRNLNRVKRAVLNIDPTAFITISNVSEINGNGFTTMFGDEEYVPIVSQRREGIKVIEDEGKK